MNPMAEIRVGLKPRLSIPNKELNVNSLLFCLLRENMADITFRIGTISENNTLA
jgi:hypothetical protein